MRRRDLAKLARLASGAAVLSAGALACTPSDTATDQHRPVVNAPYTPPPTGSGIPTGAGDLAEAGITIQPGMNGPNGPLTMTAGDLSDAGADDAGDAGDAGRRWWHHPPHANGVPANPQKQ